MRESQVRGHSPARLFISYATPDQATAEQLAQALTAEAADVWLASRAVQVGENYAEEIYRRLQSSDAVVVLLSRASIESVHVRREVNIAIDLRRPVLPLALQPGIVGSHDLPLDWRYWLGIVQVFPFSGIDDAVNMIISRTKGPTTAPVERRPAARPKVDDQTLETVVRTSLIQVATEGRPFGIVVERCRHLRCSRDRIEQVTRHFKATGLVTFSEPLNDSTTIQLAV